MTQSLGEPGGHPGPRPQRNMGLWLALVATFVLIAAATTTAVLMLHNGEGQDSTSSPAPSSDGSTATRSERSGAEQPSDSSRPESGEALVGTNFTFTAPEGWEVTTEQAAQQREHAEASISLGEFEQSRGSITVEVIDHLGTASLNKAADIVLDNQVQSALPAQRVGRDQLDGAPVEVIDATYQTRDGQEISQLVYVAIHQDHGYAITLVHAADDQQAAAGIAKALATWRWT